MRAVGCRRCHLRSRRPPEETPPSYGRRAAPFLVCAGLLLVSRRRLSAIAAWVPASHMPLSPLAPFVARPPFAPLTAPLPGGYVCPRRLGRGARSLRGRSVGVSLPQPSAQSPVRSLRGRGGGRSRWPRCPSPLRGCPSPPPPFCSLLVPPPPPLRSLSVSLAFVGGRSWGGCAAPPPSRPKSLVAPPAPMGRCGTVRLLLVGR